LKLSLSRKRSSINFDAQKMRFIFLLPLSWLPPGYPGAVTHLREEPCHSSFDGKSLEVRRSQVTSFSRGLGCILYRTGLAVPALLLEVFPVWWTQSLLP